MENEFLDIVDSEGNTTGIASREDVHRNKLLHKVVHLLVFNSSGELLLQKRSRSKEIEPKKSSLGNGTLQLVDMFIAVKRFDRRFFAKCKRNWGSFHAARNFSTLIFIPAL